MPSSPKTVALDNLFPVMGDAPASATASRYAGKTPEQILQMLYASGPGGGFTQEGVNALYAARGLSNPPTVPAGIIGAHRGGGRNLLWYDSNGKRLKSGGAGVGDFMNQFGTEAVDPFRERSSISNLAGGILNGVGSYVGGPVWQAMTAVADYGNKALGNDDGTSYTDGKRSGADRAGAAIGAIAGSFNGPGSYGANNPPTTGGDPTGGAPGTQGGPTNSGTGGGGIFGGGVTNSTSAGFLGRDWGDWVDTLIDLGGAYMAGDAASDAARDQSRGAKEAIAETRRQYDQNRADLAPYRESGVIGLNEIQRGLGYEKPGTTAMGDFNRDFTMDDFVKDPGYQFRMDEGTRALEGSASARGGLLSGRTGKELERYGEDYASGEYSNAYNRFNADRNTRFNRLASLAGVGQTATSTGVAAGTNSANSIADLTLERANADAAGRIGRANAYGQGFETLANFYRNRKYGSGNTNWIGG